MTRKVLNGRTFSVDEKDGFRSVHALDRDLNLQAIDPGVPGDTWYTRNCSDGGLGRPDEETYLVLEAVSHDIPEGVQNIRLGDEAVVVPVENHDSRRTNFLIRWPDGGMSRRDGETWEVKWQDGRWVPVPEEAEHARICEVTFEKSPYSGRRR